MSSTFADAFRNRSVFVTGHTGFKGSWLTLWLHHLQAQITGYSLTPPTEPNHFTAASILPLLSLHCEADIRNADSLASAIERAQPDVVFHLAAQSLVWESYRSPRETFEVNVIGTAALLDAVAALRRPCVVLIVTSDKCYENREQLWGYREIDTLGGQDPYSASKGAAEILIDCYRRSYFPPERLAEHGVKLASVRAGNVIGGGDWADDRIVTDVVRQLSANRPVQVRSPQAVRPWQHVLEPLSGYLTLAARLLNEDDPALCSAFNFGPDLQDQVTVAELVETFIQAWGSGSWQDASRPGQPHEAGTLRLCTDKARWQLGWQPRWDLQRALHETAAWYRRFYNGSERKMREVSLEQLHTYEAEAAGEGDHR